MDKKCVSQAIGGDGDVMSEDIWGQQVRIISEYVRKNLEPEKES